MPLVNATRTLGTLLPLLLLAGLACSEVDSAAGRRADPWPLALQDATVLGYAAVCLPADLRDGLLQETFGWTPAGLVADRPLALVRFDTSTFGGPAAIILPVRDGPALLASLRACPGVAALGEDRYAFRPPVQSGLGILLMLASGWEARSPLDALASLGKAASLEFVMQVRLEDGRALIVPSFEALAVCRDFLDEVPGYATLRPTAGLVSLDLAQLRIVYAEQIRSVDQQLQALVTGARLGGPLGLLGALASGAGSDRDGDPGGEPGGKSRGRPGGAGLDLGVSINWELVWALRAMLDLEAVDALQLHVTAASDGAHPAPAGLDGLLASLTTARLRWRLAPDSALRPVLDTLRPVPDGLDARLLLAAEPDRFGPAFAAWCRPLADFTMGEGAPSDRYVDALASLLSGFDGLLGVFQPGGPESSPVILASVREPGVDLERVVEWLGPLLRSAGVEELPTAGQVHGLDDGRQQLRGASGEVVLTTGRRGPVQWFTSGEGGEPPADLLIRFAGSASASTSAFASDGPSLSFDVLGARAGVFHVDGETLIDVTLPGAD
jgi:hypothetical protein